MLKALILRLLFFGVIIVEFFNGLLGFYVGFFTLSKIYYVFVILILLISLITFHPRKFGLSLLILSIVSILAICRNYGKLSYILTDINFFLRSGFIMYVVYEFMVAFKFNRKQYIDKFLRVQTFIFYCVSIAIYSHKYFGFGGTFRYSSGAIRDSYFSFFDSGNTLIALYIVSYISILYLSKRRRKYIFDFLLVFSVMLLTGSKVGLVGVFVLMVIKVLDLIFRWSYILGKLMLNAIYTGLIIIALNLKSVIEYFIVFLINYSSEGAKISKLNLDILDILFSRRNIQIENAIIVLYNSTFFEMLSGIGYVNERLRLGMLSKYEEMTMVEVDAFDILLSFGFIGLFVYFFLYILNFRKFLKLFRHMSQGNNLFSSPVIMMLIFLLLLSFSSGHVLLNTPTCLTLGVLFSFAKNIEYKYI